MGPPRPPLAAPRLATLRLGAMLLGAALPSGCARTSAPVTIAQALAELQRELGAAGAVSAVGSDPARFAAAARAAQCAGRQADPEVPLLAHDLTVDLTGSFTATGGFTVGSSVVGTSLNLGATRGQTQELVLPLSFVALSEVPAIAAAQRLAPLATLPPADRAAETAPILQDRDRLRMLIDGLIASWTPAVCGTQAAPSGLFHPSLRPGSGAGSAGGVS